MIAISAPPATSPQKAALTPKKERPEAVVMKVITAGKRSANVVPVKEACDVKAALAAIARFRPDLAAR